MGYEVYIYRTPELEITTTETLKFRQVKDEMVPYTEKDVDAKEVLYMSKAYWLGNAIKEHGTDAGEFIYLHSTDMERILELSKDCLMNKGDAHYVDMKFHIGYLSSYEDMVIWEQFAYFNRCVGNLLRNKNEEHYWYLKLWD